MNDGWIKLHRKLRDNPIYTNSNAVHVWIECLLRATHQEREFYNRRTRVNLEPGQFLMGRDEFGDSIGMSGSTVWYWLQQFESDSMVDIKRTPKGSVVTIKNWIEYQGVDSTVDNKKTASEQQMNTNKNVKNDKNEEKISTSSGAPNKIRLTKYQVKALLEEYPVLTEDDLEEERHATNRWLAVSGKEYSNYALFFRKWLRRVAKEKREQQAQFKDQERYESMPQLPEEERKKNLKRVAGLKQELEVKSV